MDLVLIVIFGVLVSIGVMLFFVGGLVSGITALGNRRYIWGVFIFLFLPLALIYCLLNWQVANYPGKLILFGTVILLLSCIVFTFTSFGSLIT